MLAKSAKSEIEHPTSNTGRFTAYAPMLHPTFDIRCWMLDVRCWTFNPLQSAALAADSIEPSR